MRMTSARHVTRTSTVVADPGGVFRRCIVQDVYQRHQNFQKLHDWHVSFSRVCFLSHYAQHTPFRNHEKEGAQSHASIMDDFRTVQTTTVVGGGNQFANSEPHIREKKEDAPLHTKRKG